MEKKQTAIEWLIKEFNLEKYNLDATLDFARSIEKQQMEQAVSYGISNADMTDNRGYFDFDQYYKETYGN